jgi:DNA-binding transcriptional regulator YiaG
VISQQPLGERDTVRASRAYAARKKHGGKNPTCHYPGCEKRVIWLRVGAGKTTCSDHDSYAADRARPVAGVLSARAEKRLRTMQRFGPGVASRDEGLGVRERRRALGITRGEAARELDVAPNTLSLWESGHRAMPLGALRALERMIERKSARRREEAS